MCADLRLDARDLPIGHDADGVCHLPAPALGVPAVVDHEVVGGDLSNQGGEGFLLVLGFLLLFLHLLLFDFFLLSLLLLLLPEGIRRLAE